MRIAVAALVGLTAFAQPNYPVIRVTGEPPLWRLEPLAVITAPDGVGFTRLSGLVLGPRGGVVVVDRGEQRIFRFDDAGKLLGTVGRVGAGPGEFRIPYTVALLGDDLVAYDPMNARIGRWDRDGKWVGQILFTSRVTGDLSAYSGVGGSVWLQQGGLGPSGKFQHNFIRVAADGPRDTIWFPHVPGGQPSTEPPKGSDGYVVCVQKDGFSWFYSPFSQPTRKHVVTQDGRLLALDGMEYRLPVMRVPGDTLKLLEHVVPRAPIGDAEWKAGLLEYEQHLKENPGASCSGRQVRPKTKPAIRDLATDPLGRVWVERYMAKGFQWEAWQGDKLVGAFVVPDTARNVKVTFGADRVAFARYRHDDGGYEVRHYRFRK